MSEDKVSRFIAERGVTKCPPAYASAPDDDPSDYELHIRVKNGRILAAMRRLGIGTVRQLIVLAGVRGPEFYNLINLKKPAMTVDGEWTVAAKKIAVALDLPPEALFTERQRATSARRNLVIRKASEEEIDLALAALEQKSPEELVTEGERSKVVRDILGTLPARAERVLRIRYGLGGSEQRTFDQSGELLGVTRERVRQIETKAIRELQKRFRRRADLNL